MMINRAILLKKALHIVLSSDNNLKKYFLSSNDWNYINEIHKFLQVCYLFIYNSFNIYKYIILININLYSILKRQQILLLANYI